MPDKHSNNHPLSSSAAREGAAHSSSSQPSNNSSDSDAEAFSALTVSTVDYVHLSKEVSRQTTPFAEVSHPDDYISKELANRRGEEAEDAIDSSEFSHLNELDEEEGVDMPSDLRRSEDDKAHWRQPLLSNDKSRHSYDRNVSNRPGVSSRRSSFKERDPEAHAAETTRKRYTYAAGFLVISLISFAVQTETAVYIQHTLRWNKAFCMMYVYPTFTCKVRDCHTDRMCYTGT